MQFPTFIIILKAYIYFITLYSTGSASDQRSTGQAARQCEGTGGRGVRRWDTTTLQEHSGPYNSHKGQR